VQTDKKLPQAWQVEYIERGLQTFGLSKRQTSRHRQTWQHN